MICKPIEIFCGTGGVGKTTLATSRALFLAKNGKKVLLITIDPAKRLKQILGMDSKESGEVVTISSEVFNEDKAFTFDALLMSPAHTLKRMAEANNSFKDFDNHIIKILTKPYGGMNEIMAIIEVQYQLSTGNYDTIVLDTPPGKHFIDFLNSTQKIKKFFDKTFVEIFKYLGKNFSKEGKQAKTGMLSLLVKTGIKKLLSYLEKVTGESFVEEFIEAVAGLYRNKDAFLTALDFQSDLQREDFSNWFLVTSVEQQKMTEASDMQSKAEQFMHGDSYMTINKCLGSYLDAWKPHDDDELERLKSSMLERENKIKGFAGGNFKEILEFPEVLGPTPIEHVSELAKSWYL